ncbi:hypothetical protein NQ317_017489 [Molorchus minor]|uniref:C-type lectin domain-containing protein n=1 Tax=Molorchus minor TaxID=1323400 RepID=A0ABQ9JKM6_9CUCU|nr:hypothetical protein NQ317_017489 [Molorchus minor]
MNFLTLAVMFYFACNKIFSREHCQSNSRIFNYYKIRNCHKSTLHITGLTNTLTLKDCKQFARQRNALAFNFSPKRATQFRKRYVRNNCQALGCPEISNSSTLVMDLAFDYYSAYGNWNRADLADVLTEVRTNQLSDYINDTIQEWYKAAFVGLDDTEEEGNFRTVSGITLKCFRYRAWGPGQPISRHRNEDCVILDSDKMWRVVSCSIELPALCEFYPEAPSESIDYRNVTCEGILDKSQLPLIRDNYLFNFTLLSFPEEKKMCNSTKSLFELYNNSTREDKCAILHFNDDFPDEKETFGVPIWTANYHLFAREYKDGRTLLPFQHP